VALGPVGVIVGVAEGTGVVEGVGVHCVCRVGVLDAASREEAGASSTGAWDEPAFARAVRAIAVGR